MKAPIMFFLRSKWYLPSSENFRWWPFLLLAVAVRYALVPLKGGFPQDREILRAWAQTMRTHPLDLFYRVSPNPDHLPGDLILLKVMEFLHRPFGSINESFDWFSRALPIGADLLCAILIASLLTFMGKEKAGRIAALAFLFLPFSFFLSGFWTSYDSVSLALALIAIRLMISRETIVAAPAGIFAAWTLLVKPQLILILLPFFIYYVVSSKRSLNFTKIGTFTVSGLLFTWILSSIYGLGVLWKGPSGSLVERYKYAADLWPYSSNGAPNIWAWVHVDATDNATIAGVSHFTLGAIGFLLCVGVFALVLTRCKSKLTSLETVVWSSAAIYAGLFFTITRMHGRYSLPLFALTLILAGLWTHRARLMVGLNALLVLAFIAPALYTEVKLWDYTVLRAASIPMAMVTLLVLLLPILVKEKLDEEKA